jgi:mono/diheme cytochrome c family protein
MHSSFPIIALLFAASSSAFSAPLTFDAVRPVLETNCVHCHGAARLPKMPSFSDTDALAKLIGPGKLIVPRRPDKSRMYQIVIYADEHPGAMPPTGHAISKKEMATLRTWIADGAALPKGAVILLKPKGPGPRSR